MLLRLVGLGETRAEMLQGLSPALSSRLKLTCVTGPFLEIPPGSYHAERRQYDADLIMERLLARVPGRFLAVTTRDLFTSSCDLNFIFGQAQCPGRGAIVSSCRLDPSFYGLPKNPDLLLERLVKEAVHEVGHTFGLTHCPRHTCVMSFSNSVLDVDRKTGYLCPACFSKLEAFRDLNP
jgi:archaemetzincin